MVSLCSKPLPATKEFGPFLGRHTRMFRRVVKNKKPVENSTSGMSKSWARIRQIKWLRLAAWITIPIVVVGLWCLIRWAQHREYFDWVPEWLFLTSSLSAPASTLLASGGVIIAAGIAFWNGEKTRQEEREKWVGAKQQDAVRSLRDRYFHITELLSENSSYAQREAAVYSLVALSDDWASFYSDDTEAAIREQQTCLNVIVGQLRDQLPNKDNHERRGPTPG